MSADRDYAEHRKDCMTKDPEYTEYRQKYKKDLEYFTSGGTFSRRALAKMAFGGVAAATVLGNVRAVNAMANDVLADGKGVKLMHRPMPNSVNPSADDLRFINEIGFKYCYAAGGGGGAGARTFLTVDEQKAAKKRYADAGLVLHNIRYMVGGPGNYALNSLLLDLPDRAQGTEHLKQYIRATGKNGAGFDYTGGRSDDHGRVEQRGNRHPQRHHVAAVRSQSHRTRGPATSWAATSPVRPDRQAG